MTLADGLPVLADINTFDKGKLKETETQEKIKLPNKEEVLQERAEHQLKEEISKGVDLKHVEPKEAVILPDQETIDLEKAEVKLTEETTKGADLKDVDPNFKTSLPDKGTACRLQQILFLHAFLCSRSCAKFPKLRYAHMYCHTNVKRKTISLEKTEQQLREEIAKGTELKHVEVCEKDPLPSNEEIVQEKTEIQLRQEIQKGADLKHVEVVEKDALPTKEDIEAEKRLSQTA